jgi:hypothetical protein
MQIPGQFVMPGSVCALWVAFDLDIVRIDARDSDRSRLSAGPNQPLSNIFYVNKIQK